MELAERPAKIKGVHSSFPLFIRLACLHVLTVGFLSTMVFAIGRRVLAAFSGMRLLFSPKLMFLALLLLTAGCLSVSARKFWPTRDCSRQHGRGCQFPP